MNDNQINKPPKIDKIPLILYFLFIPACAYNFPLKGEPPTDTALATDSETADTDTATSDTTMETNTNPHTAGTETETTSANACPTGLAFDSSTYYTQAIYGTSGGTEYHDRCSAGQVIVGFRGYLTTIPSGTQVHGSLGTICGVPRVSLSNGKCIVQTSVGTSLSLRGTVGDIEWTQLCPENEIIMGFKAWIGADIDSIVFRCAPLIITSNGNGFAITRGPFTDLASVGGEMTQPQEQTDCPDGQVATMAHLFATSYFRAIGLGCQSPTTLD
jgi:hypothetical protein